MHRSTLQILACPSCRSAYELVTHTERAGRIEQGYLLCPVCAIVIPILDGFVFFTEPMLHEGQASPSALAAMGERLFGTRQAFQQYRQQKRERNTFEPYAAFQPFNESTRAVEPLLPHAAGPLREPDFILDTWCRTGWSGEWLAGRFPRQRVISLWEGNNSVLGYRGFRHLLPSEGRAPNLDIIFTHPEKPLPFCDSSFGLLHALDSLHRYSLNPFAAECLRVTRVNAALVFAHLHLSNAVPEPFFERGCNQFHGRDYRAWLDRVTAKSSRRGWIFSEAALFNGPAVAALVDTPDTAHYNGLACLLPDLPVPAPLATASQDPRFIVNPLFRINFVRATARVAPALFNGAIGNLLERHPVYQSHLPAESMPLAPPALLAVLLAATGARQNEILAAAGATRLEMESALQKMIAAELLLPADVSFAAHQLQRFHANQLPCRNGGVLDGFWSRLEKFDGSALTLEDGDVLCGSDLCRFRESFATALAAYGLAQGAWIAVSAKAHPLLLVAAISAASSGFNVRIVERPEDTVTSSMLLHGDGESAPAGVTALPLGLTGGREDSLLALLGGMTVGGDVLSDDGLVEFMLDQAYVRCRLADLVDGCESLSHQLEMQLAMVEGENSFVDLLAFITALLSGMTVRALVR